MPPNIYVNYCKEHLEKEKQSKLGYKYMMKAFSKKRIGVCGSYEEYMKLAYGDNPPKTGGDADVLADIRNAGNLLYFLNTDGTVSLLPGWATCVKINDNPYYDETEASDDGLAIIFDHSLSTPEMREYIIKHKLIPDAALSSVVSPEAGRKLFQRNMRFFNDYADRDTMPYISEM